MNRRRGLCSDKFRPRRLGFQRKLMEQEYKSCELIKINKIYNKWHTRSSCGTTDLGSTHSSLAGKTRRTAALPNSTRFWLPANSNKGYLVIRAGS